MRQSYRRKLLYFLILLFILAGTSVAFYAQGYRIDLKDFSLQKIGAIYVRSFPSGATIYMDNQPVKKQLHLFSKSFWFLQNGTLISDLFPKKYNIKLTVDGFEDWSQTVEVRPSLVTELKYAVMLPKTETLISTTTKNFWLLGNNIITQNASGTLLMGGAALPGKTILNTNEPSSRVITTDGKNTYVYDLNANHSQNITSFGSATGIPKSANKPILTNSSDEILFEGPKQLYLANLAAFHAQEIAGIAATSAIDISPVAVSDSYFAWTEFDRGRYSSVLTVYNRASDSKIEYTLPFYDKTVQIEWEGENIAFIQGDGSFYYGSPLTSQGIQKIASDALEFNFSHGLDRVAVRERSALEIIPLSSQNQDEYTRFDLPDSQSVLSISWYGDDWHLFLNYPDLTSFLDVKDTNLEHLYKLNVSGAQYIQQNNELYFMDKNALQGITFPQ